MENSLDKPVAISGVENVADRYSSTTSLRMIMTAIPVVGSAIDAALSTDAQNRFQQRTEYFFEQINIQMQLIKEDKINKDYIQSEEFADLVVLAVNESRKTRSRDKINLYSRILVQSIKQTSPESYSPEEYLMILASLTEKEVYIASKFYEGQKDRAESNAGMNDLQWLSSINWRNGKEKELRDEIGDDFDLMTRRIANTGLIKEITGAFMDYTGGEFIITKSFRKLMSYLESNNGN